MLSPFLQLRFVRPGAALVLLGSALAANAMDSYNAQSNQLTLASLAIGGVTYSNVVVTPGAIVTPPSGTSPNGSEDTYDLATGLLTVQQVSLGSTVYYNVVITVNGLVSIGSVSGADTFDGSHLSIGSLQLGNSSYTNVLLDVGLSNLVGVAGGMPTASQDQFFAPVDRLFIPAVQVGSRVYTNVTLSVGAGNLVSVGGVSTTPVGTASGDLHNYYVAASYLTNAAGTSDIDQLSIFEIGALENFASPGCPAASSCNYAAPTISLSSSGSAAGGVVAVNVESGVISSPDSGAGFGIPTLVSLASAGGATWQGAISFSDGGGEFLAMETDSKALPGYTVGVVPLQGASDASLANLYTIVGIATNPSGVAGDEGLLDSLQFDGKGGFSGTETSNTWNPNTRTGGIHATAGASSCPNGATGTNLICGSYSVSANGSMTLTFQNGINAGATFTGAMNSEALVLTNLSTTKGPRALLVGVAGPTSTQLTSCEKDPLDSSINTGSFEIVEISFNYSLVQQATFNAGTTTFTLGGGTVNGAGTISSLNGGDTANFSVNGNCFMTLPRQTDNLNNIFEYHVGAVSPNGGIYVLSDFDTSGGGPDVIVGMRVINTTQLP